MNKTTPAELLAALVFVVFALWLASQIISALAAYS